MKTTLDSLVAQVLAIQAGREQPVVIDADKGSRYEDVIGVLDRLQQGGVKQRGVARATDAVVAVEMLAFTSDRPERAQDARGKWTALMLALFVNLLFVGVLVFSVSWQNRKPEAVTAELYAPPPVNAPRPQPKVEPPPQPKAEPPPEPKPVIQAPGAGRRKAGQQRSRHRAEGEARRRAQAAGSKPSGSAPARKPRRSRRRRSVRPRRERASNSSSSRR